MYIALHNHTVWSLLDGMNRIEDMVLRAKELGMNSLAITDHGVLYGTIEFYKTCRKHGIKPIIGCEVYVTGNRTNKDRKELDRLVVEDPEWWAFKSTKRKKKPVRKTKNQDVVPAPEYDIVNTWSNCHLVLLARTQEGYENLLHIASDANLTGFYYKPLTDKSVLREHGKGIIALSACIGGEIPQLIVQGAIDQAKALAREYNEIFDEFYLELQPGSMPDQILVNETLKEFSKELGIPLVCTSDSHYLTKEDAETHEVLLAVQTGKKMTDEDRMKFPEMIYWLKSEDEMRADGMPEDAIANTQVIADKCDVEIPLDRLLVPKIEVPEGYDTDTYLSKLAYDGLFKYALTSPIQVEKYKERLQFELDVVIEKKLSGYFLIVYDFIKWANDHGIMTGPGRGSAAGSLISYLIGITKLDPIEYDLLFERFINPERKSYPDIDVDIEYTRRHEVIRYVSDKYGWECVCQIGTFGTMATRAVLKDVSRALDIPFEIVNEINKQIPIVYGQPYTLRQCLYGDEKKGYQPIKAIVDAYTEYPQLFKVAIALEDNPRHASAHASGVVISPAPVQQIFPLMRNKEEEATSQYDGPTLEKLGVIKFDFLGLITLSLIRDTCNLIRDKYGIDINPDRLPLNDPETYKLLSAGETDGVFQVESSGMKQLLRELKPRDFSAIVAAIALYRPGPMENIPAYTASYNGYKEPQYFIPEFEPVLKETFGIIVYQEQVMRIAREFAGYTPGQADALRKAMGKKDEKLMDKELKKFVYGYDPAQDPDADPNDKPILGLVAKGMTEEKAVELAAMVKKFAAYAFNKSHSAGYAVICYQTAWLKAHYPDEFMAALLTTVCGDKEKVSQYLTDAKRLGMKVLPPDVNASDYGFINEGEHSLRYALGSISGVGETNVENLIKYRPYTSLEDLITRTEKKAVNKKVLTALALSGALDSLVPEQKKSEDPLTQYIEEVQEGVPTIRHRLDLLQYIYKLRGDTEELDVEQFTSKDELQYEVEYLGMYLSRHPLDGIAEPTNWEGMYYNSPFDCIAIIRDFKVIQTKKKEDMAFIDIESLEGHKDLVIFPSIYSKVRTKIQKDKTAIFTIRKRYNGDQDSLIIENIKPYKEKVS